MTKLLIKIPTFNRDYSNWFHLYVDNITNLYTRILISVDHNDPTPVPDYVLNHERVTVVYGDSDSKIHAINRDINDFEFDWDVLLVGSDDMYPQIKGFDQIILDDMKRTYPDGDGCLWYDTEDQDKAHHIPGPRGSIRFLNIAICMLPVMGRKYYDRFNYVYHPDYQSFWCDNEQTRVAQRLRKITYIRNRIIKHMHPAWTNDGLEGDETYSKANKTWQRDHNTYRKRQRVMFNNI